ncbi:hypothetical protein C5167_050829 [Papaver somniferum]|uniref:SWIM-type domain-containing protein n=2 Tax=Papaver somniferum TaxID=3469 RepID=A0A4Y7KR72_PAPSO|nr:hypothetical protein C5167_050829 [Papaver somniferum]
MANARWVALRIMRYVKDHVQCKPSTIKRRVKRKYKVKISYWTAWHARHICLERIFGSYEKSYGQVPELCRQIMEANPGSIATWSKDTVHRQFEGLFVMYKASLDGFLNGCRSIIGLDGTFLKGKYGGMVLAAMGLDNNNGIFPIAIYICRNECKETWNKFLSILAPYVTRHEQPLTFISDQQKGLIDGVARQFAQFNHYHRFCFRHLYKNFKKKFPGSHLETLVWRAAKSYNEIDYKHWMKEVAEYDPAAVTWLEKHPLEEWTRWKFDHTSRCEHISNNFSESFNSWILELRHSPICKFVMEYEKLVKETLYSREKKGQGWCQTGLINRAEERLKGHRGNVHFLNCYPSTENVWLVENGIEMTWKVNLTRKECNCGAWQVGGVPCIHAMAVIVEKDENAYSYADPCHLISKYMMTYDGHVEPTANPLTWLEVEDVFKVNPPRVVRPAGRPRNLRRRDRDEADGNTRNQKRCGICKIYGNNRAGCEGAKDGDPSTIGVNIIYGPHVRRPHNEDGDGITTSAETGSSSRPQRTNAGMRITRFGITTNSSRPTNGGVLRGGIPPMAAVRGRGGRVGARGAGRGRASGSGGAVRGRGNVVVGAVRGRGGRAEVVGGRGIGSTAAAGTQSSQTSTITVQSTRGRGTESVASYARMRGGETRFPSYPVENMTRRSASLMGLIEDQPPVKRGKQAKKGAAVHWY